MLSEACNCGPLYYVVFRLASYPLVVTASVDFLNSHQLIFLTIAGVPHRSTCTNIVHCSAEHPDLP